MWTYIPKTTNIMYNRFHVINEIENSILDTHHKHKLKLIIIDNDRLDNRLDKVSSFIIPLPLID